MANPIDMTQKAMDSVTELETHILDFIEHALSDHFFHKRYKKPRLLDDMGGIRTLVQMLNGVRFPKGCTPVKVGCTPAIFEPATVHGVEAVKASFTVEIIAIKEATDGQ